MQIQVDTQDSILHDAQRTWALVNLWAMADSDGRVAGPVNRLASRWGCSPHTVQRLVRELEAGGWVERVDNAGRVHSYQLTGRGIARAAGDGSSLPDVSPVTHLSSSPVSDASAVEPESSASKRRRTSPPSSEPSEASRLLHQHANRYTDRFEQPFPVAWARDTQIYKRLLRVYGVEMVDVLQTQYLSQSLDSFAAKRGFSVPQFASDIAGLAAQLAVRQQLTADQMVLVAALQDVGIAEAGAVTLVVDHPLEVIRDQLRVHHWRQQNGQFVSPSRLERAIRERWAVPDAARPVDYPEFPVAPMDESTLPDATSPAMADWLARAVVKA